MSDQTAPRKATVLLYSDDRTVREQVRLAVRKVSTRWTGKKPIVDVLMIEA